MRHKAGRRDSGMKSARQGRLARSTIRIQCKKEKKATNDTSAWRKTAGRKRGDREKMKT